MATGSGRRVRLALPNAKVCRGVAWLVKNRTCGPLLKVRSHRAHVQAIQQTDVMMVFPQRGGKLIKSLEILPSVTACRCSQRASMAQFG